MSFEIDGRPIPAGAFDDVLSLIRLVTDMKTYGKRLENLQAEIAKADARIEAAEGAEAKLALRVAELDRREAKIADLEVETAARSARVDDKQNRLHEIFADIKTQGDRFKREKLRYAGVLEHFNERLQDLPDWTALAQLVLGQPDPHMSGDHQALRTASDDGIEVPENLIEGSTLTRRSSRPPKPSRSDMARGAS
jgi:hypothetical protein